MSLKSYNNLGRTGLKISRLCFGVMNFGRGAEFFGYKNWCVEKQQAAEMLDAFLEAGGNFFDTADAYNGGQSEEILGELLKERGIRDQVVITTKYTCNMGTGPNSGSNGRKNIMQAVEGSLKRLGTDYIDLYIMHFWDTMTPAEEVLRTMDDLVSAGKIRHYGLSNVPGWYAGRMQAIAEVRGMEQCAALQLEYSLVQRNIEREYIDLGTQYGMGILAWSPLCMGLLSGRYQPSEDGGLGSGEGRLAALEGITDNLSLAGRFNAANWKIVAELESVANDVGRTMAQVALNWGANQPGIAALVMGATQLSQLEENLQALDFSLTEEQNRRLCEVGQPELIHPYNMFAHKQIHEVVYLMTEVKDKHDHYYKR